MNFVFEDVGKLENFLSCPDVNPSGIRRFAPSPLAVTMLHRTQLAKLFPIKGKPRPYIIATGVNHHPNDWTTVSGRQSAFTFLHKKQLNDLRDGKAMVLFDQSLEGYQTSWLWEFFHNDCETNNINPASVIYTTGNMLAKEQYNSWAEAHSISNRISVIPYTHFESDMYMLSKDLDISLNVEKHLRYKETHETKTFNCLQKRLRDHRIWFYTKMYQAGILNDGLVSMNAFSTHPNRLEGSILPKEELEEANKILPLLVYGKNNNEHDDSFYIRRIQDNVCLDTWVSVISEASFADQDLTLFLSEKIFKPIVCFHPFIIVGNKGSLKELRRMGYKTFDGFIDERYDELTTFERYDAIIESIKKIINIEDKAAWYQSMQDILIHNYNTLVANAKKVNPAYIELQQIYNNYFKLGKNDVR